MSTDDLITLIEDAADAEHCTAHVLDTRRRAVYFCISPHDEDAGWAADVRVRWTREIIALTMEHSGPIGRCTVDNDDAGRRKLVNYLRHELAE